MTSAVIAALLFFGVLAVASASAPIAAQPVPAPLTKGSWEYKPAFLVGSTQSWDFSMVNQTDRTQVATISFKVNDTNSRH